MVNDSMAEVAQRKSCSTMTNILYLSYDGITDHLGQSQILPYLKGLTNYGYNFDLVGFEKAVAFQKQKSIINQEISGYSINWIPLKYHKNPPIISTLYDLWKLKKTATSLIKSKKIQIVHCRSYTSMLIGIYLKKKYDLKLIFDMRGFWANERVDGNIWNLNNPVYKWIYRFFKKKEIEFSLESDHIISLTHAGKNEMTSGRLFSNINIKIPTNKITVIPCATDYNLFDPEKISAETVDSYKRRLGLNSNDKVLVYLGSLGTWYMLQEMLEFFKLWKKTHPNYKFLFVTKDNIGHIHHCSTKIGINLKDIVHTSADRLEVPIFLKLADLGIFFIKPAYSKKASSAVKMGEMIAMDLPFITNKGVGDADYLLNRICPENILDITRKQFDIGHIKTKENANESLKNHEVRDYFDFENAISVYMKVYYELTSAKD